MDKLIVFILFSFLLLPGCKNSNDFKSDFENHKYDQTVIQNLPLYDTLRQLILTNYDSFHLSSIKTDFPYIYNFDTASQISGYNNTDISEKIYPKTVELFKTIGSNHIFGFTISKDSTIEFLINNTHLSKYFLDVRERLYWFANSNKINKTSFPIKDTLLSDNWQYQIWYDKRAEF